MPTTADLGRAAEAARAIGDGPEADRCTRRCSPGRAGAGEADGPEEMHVVILDNGRSNLLRGRYREMLACIRCGACLNVCPVYRKSGGAAYGPVYSGPMGAVLLPLLVGLDEAPSLPHASSLCGACTDACPVKIPLHELLLDLRRDLVEEGVASRWERLGFTLWSWAWSSVWRVPRVDSAGAARDSRSRAGSGPAVCGRRGGRCRGSAAAIGIRTDEPRRRLHRERGGGRVPRAPRRRRPRSRAPASRRRSTGSPTPARWCCPRRRTSRARSRSSPTST